MKIAMQKALFIDKDWTLVSNDIYPLVPTDDILPWVIEWLKWISNNTDYKLFIISNQSFIWKWKISQDLAEAIFKVLIFKLNQQWVRIDWYFYCPHKKEDNCPCRKPKTLLLDPVIKLNDIDLSQSYVIWDSHDDYELSNNLWTKFIHVSNAFTTDTPKTKERLINVNSFEEIIGLI